MLSIDQCCEVTCLITRIWPVVFYTGLFNISLSSTAPMHNCYDRCLIYIDWPVMQILMHHFGTSFKENGKNYWHSCWQMTNRDGSWVALFLDNHKLWSWVWNSECDRRIWIMHIRYDIRSICVFIDLSHVFSGLWLGETITVH